MVVSKFKLIPTMESNNSQSNKRPGSTETKSALAVIKIDPDQHIRVNIEHFIVNEKTGLVSLYLESREDGIDLQVDVSRVMLARTSAARDVLSSLDGIQDIDRGEERDVPHTPGHLDVTVDGGRVITGGTVVEYADMHWRVEQVNEKFAALYRPGDAPTVAPLSELMIAREESL